MTSQLSAFRFETDRLLSPISAMEPTGEYLRYEGTYDTIAGMRREDDPGLAVGVWKADLKKADWPRVAQTCLLAIETRSKDLQIASWLLDAWIHIHGFAGLREGLHLLAELCDTYWDGLHPNIQDGDLEYRLAPLYWVDEKVSIQVKLVPITSPQGEEVASYTLADWETACRNGRAHPGKEDVTPARFQQSATLTPTAWLSTLAREAGSALAANEELRRVLEAQCGRHAPALSRMRETLESILSLCSAALLGREDLPQRRETDEPNGEPADMPHENGSEPGNGHGDERGIRSRAEAYQRLAEAADFLARTEPHSPVPHLVRRAVAWGGLSLQDLLPELIRDNGQLAEIYRLLQFGDSERK
jgi:type VI secretion system protein ImpA